MKLPDWCDALVAPDVGGLDDLVDELVKVLYVGSDLRPALKGAESRSTEPKPPFRPAAGIYAFRQPGGWVAVVVGAEAGAHSDFLRQDQLEPPSSAWMALALFETSWSSAAMAGLPSPLFSVGEGVITVGGAGEVGTVATDPTAAGTGWEYKVRFGRRLVNVPESGLSSLADADSPASWAEIAAAPLEDFASVLTLAKLDRPLTDVVYAFGATRTVFRAYQFKPLLKLLQTNSQRLLIADEVGLGKTIEAGLVWTELEQRERVRRGLVICPAGLTRKWRAEMKRRFATDLEIIDRRRLEEFTAQLEANEDPPLSAVMSIESLRTAPVLERLQELNPRFDLIIVDEAHALRNIGTKSFAMGELLSDWADVLLFLSATPLNLGTDDLFNLLHLLAAEEFPDRRVFEDQLQPNSVINRVARQLGNPASRSNELLSTLTEIAALPMGATTARRPEFARLLEIMSKSEDLGVAERAECKRLLLQLHTLSNIVTRTRKVDVPDAKATRRAHTIDVAWTEAEASFYVAVLEWARARALARHGIVGFATIMPLRQAASCLPAMRSLLHEKYDVLPVDEDDFDLDDTDVGESDVGEADLSSVELSTERLRRAAAAIGSTDTKFDEFERRLRTMTDAGISQVMVFSFFRRTLSYLASRLQSAYRVRVMDGSVAPDERARLMQSFREGDFDILLLSEVGSEGLDFEFVAALVNYDLPWNPMRVEQRIGRIDRFGQQHEVIHIYNFHVPGTIETDIFERLYERIHVFEESIGELEPILRDQVAAVTNLVLDPRRTEAERIAEVDRVAVAAENRRADLQRLERESVGLMTGIDELLIDGLEESLVSTGRYLGSAELRQLVTRFVDDLGGAVRKPSAGKLVYELRGSTEIEHRMVSLARRTSDSRLEALSARLRAGESHFVVFDNEDAMAVSADLISAGHPLVIAAKHHADECSSVEWRHGQLLVPGERSGRFAVLFLLLEVTGSSPAIELRSVAIDLDTNELDDDVGDAVLSGLASGRCEPVPRVVQSTTPALIRRLENAAGELRERLETERAATNDALVSARQDTVQRTFSFKIQRSRDTLAGVQHLGRSNSIVRLHEGRIRNLEARLNASLEELDANRELTVTWRPIALAEVLMERQTSGADYL